MHVWTAAWRRPSAGNGGCAPGWRRTDGVWCGCQWVCVVVCVWVSGGRDGVVPGISINTEPVSTDTKPNPNLAQCTNGS